MKKLIIAFVLILQPLLVFAAQPLSREIVTSFYTVSDELDKFELKYSKEFKHLDSFAPNQTSEMIDYIKSSRAYADILSAVKAKGFSSIEDFFDVSMRIMASTYKVEMQKMSAQDKQRLAMAEKSFDDNIKMMKQNGMPDSMIAGMQSQLQEMKKSKAAIEQVAKKVTPADIKFVKENYDWLQTFMESEDDFHGSQPPY